MPRSESMSNDSLNLGSGRSVSSTIWHRVERLILLSGGIDLTEGPLPGAREWIGKAVVHRAA